MCKLAKPAGFLLLGPEMRKVEPSNHRSSRGNIETWKEASEWPPRPLPAKAKMEQRAK